MKGDRDGAIADFRQAIRLPTLSTATRAELSALGVPEPLDDNLKLPPAKDLLDSLK